MSSQGGWNLYFYHVKRFTGSDRFFGLNEEELRKFLAEKLERPGPSDIRSIVYQPVYYEEAFSVIRKNPIRYAFWHGKESLVFFYDDGLRDMLRHVGIKSDFSFSTLPDPILFKSPILLLVSLGVVFWLLVFLCAAFGIRRGFRDQTLRPVVIFLVLSIVYVPIVAGTLAVARFRFPLTPLIFLLASFGLSSLGERRGFLKREIPRY